MPSRQTLPIPPPRSGFVQQTAGEPKIFDILFRGEERFLGTLNSRNWQPIGTMNCWVGRARCPHRAVGPSESYRTPTTPLLREQAKTFGGYTRSFVGVGALGETRPALWFMESLDLQFWTRIGGHERYAKLCRVRDKVLHTHGPVHGEGCCSKN